MEGRYGRVEVFGCQGLGFQGLLSMEVSLCGYGKEQTLDALQGVPCYGLVLDWPSGIVPQYAGLL